MLPEIKPRHCHTTIEFITWRVCNACRKTQRFTDMSPGREQRLHKHRQMPNYAAENQCYYYLHYTVPTLYTPATPENVTIFLEQNLCDFPDTLEVERSWSPDLYVIASQNPILLHTPGCTDTWPIYPYMAKFLLRNPELLDQTHIEFKPIFRAIYAALYPALTLSTALRHMSGPEATTSYTSTLRSGLATASNRGAIPISPFLREEELTPVYRSFPYHPRTFAIPRYAWKGRLTRPVMVTLPWQTDDTDSEQEGVDFDTVDWFLIYTIVL